MDSNTNNSNLNFLSRIGSYSAALYYLIGIIIYLYKGVSIFGSIPNAMVIIGLLIFAISLGLGVVIILQYKKNKTLSNPSKLNNKRFIITFLIVSFLNIVFTLYLIFLPSFHNWNKLMAHFPHQNIHIYKKKTTIDMSMRKEFDKSITDKYKVSPIRRSYNYTLIRRSEETDKIYFMFGTDGLKPEIACITHPFKFYPIALDYAIGQIQLKNYCLEIDISNQPIDLVFQIQIENIEWNVKTEEYKSDERISVIYETDTLENTFVFPKNKVPDNFELYTYKIPGPNNSKDEKPLVLNLLSLEPVKWNVLKPIRGNVYHLTWDWTTINKPLE
jgi:hypothetical protein